MDNNQSSKEIKPEIMKNASFLDLIVFKEEILKLMKDLKSEINSKVTSEFQKYRNLINKSQNKILSIESSFLSKLNYIEEKEEILNKIKTIEEEFEKNLMKQNIIINNCSKDLRNACFKYDKIIVDNLYIPSLIGQACQFPNLKEYILANKDAIDSCISLNKQKDIDLKLYKSKIDDSIIKFNLQMKMTLDNNTELIKIKIEDFEKKFYDNLNEYQSAIKNLSLNVNQNKIKISEQEIINDEKFEMFKKFQKKSDKNEKNINNLYDCINSMKNEINNIKNNLIEILSLLSKNMNKNMIKEFDDIINDIKFNINTENNNYIYEKSEQNINNTSKDSKKPNISNLKRILSNYNYFDKNLNNENINNINNFESRLFKRFNSNKTSLKNINNFIQKYDNIFLNKKSKEIKTKDFLRNQNNRNDLNNNDFLKKRSDIGKNNISDSERENYYKNNNSFNSEKIKDSKINSNNNILLSDIEGDLNNSLTINNNNQTKKQTISFFNKKNIELNNKEDKSSLISNKKEKIEENRIAKKLYNQTKQKFLNNQINTENIKNENIKNLIKENNSENNNINFNNLVNKNNKNIINKEKNNVLHPKKNIFTETISKNIKKRSSYKESKYKKIQKNIFDFSGSPMIIKNINDIIKQNTISSKNEDLLKKKIYLNPQISKNENNNLGYKSKLTLEEEKTEKKLIKRNKNQKILKISGSADFGIGNINNNYLFYDKNIEKKNEKDIYLDKDTINKLKCIKDDQLIDKPLIINKKEYFEIDINKSSVENRIIELEYFTKKKFDELVQEIKNFIPIHFNSHVRNYTIKKIKS